MRWFPFLLVVLSGVFPVEAFANTLWSELMIRSSWSLLLLVSLYFCLNVKTLTVILICEFLSIAYNLAIALGYFFTDKDLAALYEPSMVFLFFIELYYTLPRRTRRDSRDNGSGGRSVRKLAPRHNRVAAGDQVQVATCKI